MFGEVNEDQLNAEFFSEKIVKQMKYGGFRLGNRMWWEKILGTYFLSYCIITVLLQVLYLANDTNFAIVNSVEALNMLSGFMVLVVKYSTAITNEHVLCSMLTCLRDDFWSIDRLNDKQKKNAVNLFFLFKRCSDFYITTIIITIFVITLQALIRRILVNEIWFPYNEVLQISPYYEIVCIVQGFSLMNMAYVIFIPIDLLFVLLIISVCVQFRILRQEAKLLNGENDLDKKLVIKRIVDHHNTLIRFLAKFENVFSTMLLFVIGLSYMNMTLSVYVVIYEESFRQKATFVGILLISSGQILAYCGAGQFILDQSSVIGEAVYKTDWFKVSDLQIRKDLIVLIARSQQEIKISVGGIMYLNMESFLKILKTTFSLLTFLFNFRDTTV